MRIRNLLLFWAVFPLSSCVSASITDGINDYYFPNYLYVSDWRAAVAADTMAPTENIRVTTLHTTRYASHHIVRVRDRERPHIHKDHDITVFLLEGEGEMTIRGATRPCRAGDVMTINRRFSHFFVNKATVPAVAYVVFNPPFDGKDVVPVEDGQAVE